MSISHIRNFDYTILLCEKLDETRRFYQDVMRFPIEHTHDTWISFRIGSSLLALRPRGARLGWDDGVAMPGSAAVQLAFRVPPSVVDQCYDELVAKGVEVVRPPANIESWRHRALFFRDPEGNIVEIYAEY